MGICIVVRTPFVCPKLKHLRYSYFCRKIVHEKHLSKSGAAQDVDLCDESDDDNAINGVEDTYDYAYSDAVCSRGATFSGNDISAAVICEY